MRAIEETNLNGLSILWISYTDLDGDLHSMSVLNILRNIAGLGNDVSLVAVQSKNYSRIKSPNLRVVTVPAIGVGWFLPVIFTVFLAFYLPAYTLVSKVDIVVIDPSLHILSVFPQFLVAKLKKVKYVLDIRTVPVEVSGLRGLIRKFWFNLSIYIAKNLFDGMTIITPLMKNDICGTFKIDPNKVGTWPSGVDIELFNPDKNNSQGQELKKQIGLSDKFVVFYHGVLTGTRGLEKTVESIRKLKNEHPDIVVFFLGSGPIESRLQELINNQGLQGNVYIHKPVDQTKVPPFISMSDVCIVPLPNHPYWRSQSPLKLLEYLSMEKVVILSDIPAHRLVVGEEKCGVYFTSVEPGDISKAIDYVYLRKDTLSENGRIGREIVKDKYTWEKVGLELTNYLLFIKYKQKFETRLEQAPLLHSG